MSNMAERYFDLLRDLLARVQGEERDSMERAAGLIARCFDQGRFLFLFGTGHSHILAEELFYRAGGPVRVYPILLPELMLHQSASASTELERRPGAAEAILSDTPLQSGDVLLIASNSGRNTVAIDMALLARQRGAHTIALTNAAHSMAQPSRHASGKRLMEVSDIALDNHGCLGDAAMPLERIGRSVAPTSTVVGAAMLHALMCRAYELMQTVPEVFASSNVDGGEEVNQAFLDRYRGFVKPL